MRSLRAGLADPAQEAFALKIEKWLRDLFRCPVQLPTHTVAELPPAVGWRDCVTICTNETGGRTLVTSDGTNWRRVRDGAIAS